MIIFLFLIGVVAFLVFQPSKDSVANKSGSSATLDKKRNCVRFLNELVDHTFPAARAENGIVYCCGSSGDFKIGLYEKKENGKWIVRESENNCIIGEIDESSREIWLNSCEYYKLVKSRHSRYGYYNKIPNSFIMRAASWNGTYIFDDQTNNIIASFEGDAVAASVAFVCMVYEVLMYNKYHKFFHDWLK